MTTSNTETTAEKGARLAFIKANAPTVNELHRVLKFVWGRLTTGYNHGLNVEAGARLAKLCDTLRAEISQLQPLSTFDTQEDWDMACTVDQTPINIETTPEKLELAIHILFVNATENQKRAAALLRQHYAAHVGANVADLMLSDEDALFETLKPLVARYML